MELAAMCDYNLTEHAAISFYAAPVGDPAMGPPAYPHRASASEDPVAPLGHHLQDSTHIADDGVTAGLTYRDFRIEASGFHGREPDEYRWDIDSGAMDSWSSSSNCESGKELELSVLDCGASQSGGTESRTGHSPYDCLAHLQLADPRWQLGLNGATGKKSKFAGKCRTTHTCWNPL
jgi:hypothetical protein